MTQEGSKKTLEEIKAEIIEVPTEKGPDANVKELRDKIVENNFKMCLFADLFEKKAQETSKTNKDDPKIEMLKKGKAALEILKKFHEKIKSENEQLRDELMDLKLKRKKKRFFDKNKASFVEYREKIFPMLMKDCDQKADLIDSLKKKDCAKNSESDVREITRELEKLKKENEHLNKTEESIIEIRRKNEGIEVETCKIQVRNVEIETELRSFDEFVLENQIAELQTKIMIAKEEKFKREEEKKLDDFKNPNDFPTLLDFLDKSKKLKQPKRRLSSPARPPSKRRKNKTGSYSQHDKVAKPQTRSSSQFKSPMQNGQMGSRSVKSPEAQKSRVMESFGLKMKTPATSNNSANLTSQESNDHENTLQRTFASSNLTKNSQRPTFQRQNSTAQMQPGTSNADTPRKIQQIPKGRKQTIPINSDSVQSRDLPKRHEPEDYEKDGDGYLLLQRFPSRPLFPVEPLVDNPEKAVETPAKGDAIMERMETEVVLENSLLANQPSTERGLRPRKNVNVKKLSPKKTGTQDKKDGNRKKTKSPKKDKKNGRAKKKIEMSIDDDNADKLITSSDNSDKLMVVDENSIIENSANSDAQTGSSNETSIPESTGNNEMDVDQNVQNQENDLNFPEIPQNADEVNMEQESPGNENDIGNIEMFDVEMENIDPNNARESVEMSNSFERLFCSSPTLSGNLESNQSFDFNFDNSREENDSGSGNNDFDNFFNFDNNDDKNGDDFFGNNSFNSNEGKADFF